MEYIVYKAIKDGPRFRNWELHSSHADLAKAEDAARSLCPKGQEIETEPGRGDLKHGFFGSKLSDTWSARIEVNETA